MAPGLQVLRILLFHEQWLGPASAERLSAPLADIKLLQRPCTDLPRMRPEQMQVCSRAQEKKARRTVYVYVFVGACAFGATGAKPSVFVWDAGAGLRRQVMYKPRL